MRDTLRPALVLAVPWALFVAYAWPGIMSPDSVNQLAQARSGELGNWHPPIMAWLWGLLDHLVRGPALMLVLQTALFVVGLFAMFRRYHGAMRAAIVAALVFAFPPVFAVMSAIWKDSLMAGCLLCGACGISASSRQARIGGWIALFFAAALRHNAPLLVLPITALLVPYAAGRRRIAIGIALGLAVIVAAEAANHLLADVDQHPFANMIALPDTAGTLARAPDLDDAVVRELLTDAPLVQQHDIQARAREIHPEATAWVAVTKDEPALFALATTAEAADGAAAAWRRIIRTYPGTYLGYRAKIFFANIGWTRTTRPFLTAREERPTDLAVVDESHGYYGYQLAIADALLSMERWIIFRPYLYLILALGLLPLLWRDPMQRALLAGAIAYELALFLLSPGGHDYRYSHWMITVVVIASVVRVGQAWRARAAP